MLVNNPELLLPDGYGLFDLERQRMIGKGKEEFVITNRSFLMIDMYFSQEISKTIKELLNTNPNRQILVLDLAGGTESQAVRDIEKEFGGNRVRAINIDLAHNIKRGKGVDRFQGDAANIPLADSSIDIVYSVQFLPFINSLERKNVLSKVARVLKPGGIAFLDDEEKLSGAGSDKERQELASEFGVILETHDSALMVDGKRDFPKLWERETRPIKFLVMRK